MTVRRHHAAFLMQIAAMLGKRDRGAASQRHVRLVQQQALAGLCDRDERGRASGLNGQTRAPEVQLVRRASGEEFPPGAHQDRVFADLKRPGEVLDGLAVATDIVQKVRVHAATGEYADRASIGCGVVAGVLQRLPCAFKKDAVLRIGQRRFPIAHVEKFRIELVDVGEHWAGLDVTGRRPRRRVGAVFKLVVGKEGDAFDAVAQIPPKRRNVLGARKSPRHADDGDTALGFRRPAHAAPVLPAVSCARRSAAERLRARSAVEMNVVAPSASPSIFAATALMFGWPNKSTTVNTGPKASTIFAWIRIRSKDEAPRSKKLSSSPMPPAQEHWPLCREVGFALSRPTATRRASRGRWTGFETERAARGRLFRLATTVTIAGQ